MLYPNGRCVRPTNRTTASSARAALLALMPVLLSLAVPARADEAPPPQSQTPQGAAPADKAQAKPAGGTIETVTVTAQKTKQNILNVPVNVTSLSSEEARTSRIESPTDLATQMPNVDVKTNIPGAQQIITVRGVGLDDFSSTNNPTVGVYVDDVFLASFAEMDFNMYDLDRIEVLKGPQGTLYGRNSTAGAINIISAPPSVDGFFGSASAGFGNYDTFEARGFVNVPVSNDFALRFSGVTQQQGEGYWYSRVLHRDLGRQDNFSGRAQALWTPTNDLVIQLKVEGENENSEIGVGKFFGTLSTTAASCPDFSNPAHCIDFHGYTDTSSNPFRGDWNHRAPYDVRSLNTTLHVDDDLGWATLSSVTGYIDYKRGFYIDADATPFTDAEFDQNDKVGQFSQELRLAGKARNVDWLVGAYYSHDRVQTNTPGSLTDLGIGTVLITADQKTDTAAIFGQATVPLTDELNLTGGARLSYEHKSYVGGTSAFVGGPFTPPLFPISFEDATIIDRNISWHTALDWKPSADTLYYVAISRGEKSGGFFNGIAFSSLALAPFKPEILTDYEAGVKARIFNRSMFFDSSVFYYDYKDLQAQTFTNVGAVSLIKLGNIGSATLYGADIGVTWYPVSALKLRLGLGLLHSELGSFTTAIGCPTCFVPVPSGNKLPDAPDVTFNGLARYDIPLPDGFLATLQVETHYNAAVFKEALNTPYLSAGAYWLLNARASIAKDEDGWELALWGKNLTDEQYVSQVTDDGDTDGYRVFGAPRTYGLTLTHNFGSPHS